MAQQPGEDGRLLPFCLLRQPGQLKALAHPTRVKVLELLISKPMTSKQLGDALEMTAARVHYHLKFLERAGLIGLVDRRERAGVVEKYYRATSRKYLICQGIGMFGDPGAVILESLARDILSGAETAASGDMIGLICGANERIRVPWDRAAGLLAVANALQAAQERLRAIGDEGAAAGPSFELTYALYASAEDGDEELQIGRGAGGGRTGAAEWEGPGVEGADR